MQIKKEEVALIGSWVFNGKQIIEDRISKRIHFLITNHLLKLKIDKSGWTTLYRDPTDNRYWELIYPDSEMQGGGPQALIVLSDDEAKLKYGF
ncbi:Imm27 family immunity protein [Hymenobacter sp. HD11105]